MFSHVHRAIERASYAYILQLFEMEKKKIVALISSLKAAIASFISAFTALWNIKEKLKEKLKYINYLQFPNWTPHVSVLELGIVNVNVTSQIYLYL